MPAQSISFSHTSRKGRFARTQGRPLTFRQQSLRVPDDLPSCTFVPNIFKHELRTTAALQLLFDRPIFNTHVVKPERHAFNVKYSSPVRLVFVAKPSMRYSGDRRRWKHRPYTTAIRVQVTSNMMGIRLLKGIHITHTIVKPDFPGTLDELVLKHQMLPTIFSNWGNVQVDFPNNGPTTTVRHG